MVCPQQKLSHQPNGFTLIEIIAALTIIGIISAVVISRADSTAMYKLASEAATLKGHLRYAQFRAMSDNVSWGIRLGGGSYTLLKDENDAASNLPNENSNTHHLQSGVSVSGATITFDACWGSPGDADISLTLAAGGNSKTITVTRNTGFIP